MNSNSSSVHLTNVSHGRNDIIQDNNATITGVNMYYFCNSPHFSNQYNNQVSNNQNYNSNNIKDDNKNIMNNKNQNIDNNIENIMNNKNQNIDNNIENNNNLKLDNKDNNGNDYNNCNNYKYNNDDKKNSNSNNTKVEKKKVNKQLVPDREIKNYGHQNKDKNKENSIQSIHKFHKPNTLNLTYSSIISESDAIDKNEINTIKNIVEINYTTFERNRDKQISEKKTLSSLINSEIKKNLGGEWFVFVSKKVDKISFNLSTVSSTDFLTIEIGNSLFKIARTK
jgi:hypothetical protein